MAYADLVYSNVVKEILDHGIWDKDQDVRTKWADGTPAYTKSVISTQMKFNNKEVPILTQKRVAWKTAIKEILAFWKDKEYRFDYFHKHNIHIWDEWEIKDGKWKGTIGPSYGYQMGKLVRKGELLDIVHGEPTYKMLDQVDYLLDQLKKNPSSRRHITSLWNIHDLDEMALNPCVWNTQWLVKEGSLHLIVGVR